MSDVERQRQGFLKALLKDEDDAVTRAVYADWLEEHGEDDEAQRQRDWPAAKEWLVSFARECGETNIAKESGGCNWHAITYQDVVKAGNDWIDDREWFVQCDSEDARNMMHESRGSYWRNWVVVTGRPLPPDFLKSLDEEWESTAPFTCYC